MASLNFQGIDLFAGAGGLSLGARLAGITITHAVENNPAAASTYRINHPGTHLIEDDIRSVGHLPKIPKNRLVLFGGPPCQGFSTSNQRTRTQQNPKNWLFFEFFEVAKKTTPDWIVLENVKGLRETAGGYFEALIFDQFSKLGYASTLWTLCASDYGVPQKRHRLFFVGRRHGLVPEPPAPDRVEKITVRQAISDLPILKVGANVDELEYGDLVPSRYAKERRGKLHASTGHLVTANNSLVLKEARVD